MWWMYAWGKATLHTRTAPNNCGASGRATRTEIKQVLSHNPCLLKISLFRRGWWILGCILSSGCGGNCLMSAESHERARLYVTVCLCSPASVTYSTWRLLIWLRCPIQLFVHILHVKKKQKSTECSRRRLTSNTCIALEKDPKLGEEIKLNAHKLLLMWVIVFKISIQILLSN